MPMFSWYIHFGDTLSFRLINIHITINESYAFDDRFFVIIDCENIYIYDIFVTSSWKPANALKQIRFFVVVVLAVCHNTNMCVLYNYDIVFIIIPDHENAYVDTVVISSSCTP